MVPKVLLRTARHGNLVDVARLTEPQMKAGRKKPGGAHYGGPAS